jgi:hypothetical protein
MRDPRIIIALAFLFFGIAYLFSLTVEDYNWTCPFACLPIGGKIAVVLFCFTLLWLVVSQIIRKR